MSDLALRRAALVLAALGLALAGYLTYVHYAGLNVLCLASGGCEKVQTSVYAKLAGVPVAVLGLAGYAVIFVASWFRTELARAAAAGAALIGFGFSLYLTYRELFTINAICQWCVGSAVLMTLLAIVCTLRLLFAPPPPRTA